MDARRFIIPDELSVAGLILALGNARAIAPYATLEALGIACLYGYMPVVQALGGRAEVYVDTGITHGADVVAAVALGAQAALVGRAYLYGLMAGGRRGVAKAVEILTGEITRTMQLIGVNSVDELRPSHVRLRPHP